MSNFTPIVNADSRKNDKAIWNDPLGELDAAIGNLAGLTTTPKTSVAGAMGTTALGTTATTISGAIAELDLKSGDLSTIHPTPANITDAVIFAIGLGRNMQFIPTGEVYWSATSKVLTMQTGRSLRILHGNTGAHYTTVPAANVNINFSGIGANKFGIAYISGVVLNTTQTITSITVAESDSLSITMQNQGVVVLAVFVQSSGLVYSPFLNVMAQEEAIIARQASIARNVFYSARDGVRWDAVAKTLTFGANTYILHGTTGGTYTRFNSLVLDFSSIALFGFAYIKDILFSVTDTTPVTGDVVIEEYNALSVDLQNKNVIVLAWYDATANTVGSPFLQLSTETAVAGSPALTGAWNNLYPHLNASLSAFFATYLAETIDVNVVLWGDSIFAKNIHTSTTGIDATALPPTIHSRNVAWYIWQALRFNKATFRRFDYTGSFFTETGTWATTNLLDATTYSDVAWDDINDRNAVTRYSVSTDAAVVWTLGITDGESGCNFIYRTCSDGDAAATITIAAGNSRVEYWTGSAWAEANGATFSMLEVDEGANRGNTIFQKRLKLRKISPYQNTSLTVSIGKASADADRLAYWGIERYNVIAAMPIITLINSSRRGHTLDQLKDYVLDDVVDWSPDLVIFEVPIINMIDSDQTVAYSVNWVHDALYGDRAGNTNTWALVQNCDAVLVVVPHHPQRDYTSGGLPGAAAANVTYDQIYRAVRGLIVSKAHANVGMVDISTAFEREIDADPVYSNYYTALNGTAPAGRTYTDDDIHQNDMGTRVYARHLAPLLDGSSF